MTKVTGLLLLGLALFLPYSVEAQVVEDRCGVCYERQEQSSSLRWHQFTPGEGWTSGGSVVCWGAPDDKECHPSPLAGTCEDLHSECQTEEQDLELLAIELAAEPRQAIQRLILRDSSFELDIEAGILRVLTCDADRRILAIDPDVVGIIRSAQDG